MTYMASWPRRVNGATGAAEYSDPASGVVYEALLLANSGHDVAGSIGEYSGVVAPLQLVSWLVQPSRRRRQLR
ncbi:hypothetical protein JQ616_05085 [Bradyrhizobium tropiciagri]|uniref:hypothetical protein n=1 Tax=Bradyrhizobium tropiciagri TaxID=312253 RepID=UPI001BA64A20|nr:hypothetical protein [Bradyrhizobium tropiciagri]MBR0894317.1 hypothetical protein [Bradyrhizobium tropiciagri]